LLGTFEKTKQELFLDVDGLNSNSNKKMLKYVVPESNHVSINIYDIKGNEVMKVLNEYMIQGSYTCSVDVSALATGVYYCIIKSGQNRYKTSLYIVT
jgi:6-phosphogluconolactonase (cycloisomerase 2 family)